MEPYTNKFHLSYDNEVNFWLNNIINKWIELNVFLDNILVILVQKTNLLMKL